MKILWIAAIVMCLVVSGLAALYFEMGKDQNPNAALPLLLEAYKTALTFLLITLGGLFSKVVVDQVLERDRNKQTDTIRHEETRKAILKEFTTVFSEFYSIRKLYHSALSARHFDHEMDSGQLVVLKRQLLQKSVDLEGRYGALKVLAVNHFNLPRGDYQTKSVEQIEKNITATGDSKQQARLQFDLLGECYDDWRHALESSRRITAHTKTWSSYEHLLAFISSEN